MSHLSEMEMLGLAESLKSTITKCQDEISHLRDFLNNGTVSNTGQFSCIQNACGDIHDVKPNRKSNKLSPTTKLTQGKYLSELIKTKTLENSALRDSNVQLRQESKIQDQKIRDLNRGLMLKRRMIQKSESEKAIVCQLKKNVDDKFSEIRQLRKNLEKVKLLLGQEQNKAKCFQKCEKNSAPTSKVNRRIQSKLECLLSQLNQLKVDQEFTDFIHYHHRDGFVEEIDRALNRLMLLKMKVKSREMNDMQNIEKSISNLREIYEQSACGKNDKCIQVPENSTMEETVLKMTNFVETVERSYRNFSPNENSQTPTEFLKMVHRRTKSV